MNLLSYKMEFLDAFFVDDMCVTKTNFYIDKMVGDIIIVLHPFESILYDCVVVNWDEKFVYISKLRVNTGFYEMVQREYNKYNIKDKNVVD
jgi:hypothetical protein